MNSAQTRNLGLVALATLTLATISLVKTNAEGISKSDCQTCGKLTSPAKQGSEDASGFEMARAKINPDILAKPILGREDILAVLQENEAYKPADQFAPAFDASPLIGKTLMLDFKPNE